MLVTKIGSELWCYTHALTPSRSCLHPATSLADARTKRDNAKKLLAEGIDPSVERKQERRNARMARANTFEAVAKELMGPTKPSNNVNRRSPGRGPDLAAHHSAAKAAAPKRKAAHQTFTSTRKIAGL
jgi:hypothetical protein